MRTSVSRRGALLLAAAMSFSLTLATPALARDPGPPTDADPYMTCATCDGGGSGGSGGSSGAPASKKILDVRPRAQINGYYCGPATGQVIINYTRGIFKDGINSGQNADKNWKTQSQIAAAMGTTAASGTSRFGLRDALRDMAKTPSGLKWKPFADLDSGAELHDMIVQSIWDYSMPMAVAVNPHKTDDYYLPSFPKPCDCPHWIVLHGYDGFWRDGPEEASVWYAEPRGNGDKVPGLYAVDARTLWKVNRDNQRSGVRLTTP